MPADIFNPDASTYYGLELSSQATNSDNVNAATYYWAGMIVPTVSKNVTSLQVVNWSHVGSFELMTIELRSDNGSGVPSATVLQSATFTPTANFNWNSIPITSQAVVAGTKYHIVVHSANVSGTNSLEMRRIDDPDNLFGNTFRVNISTDSGSTWSGQGQYCGCVGFGYSDATFEGCGYGDWDQTSINNAADQWGEYFNPTTTFTASKIGFKVSKTAAGTPSADLTYVIMNADTATVLATGTVVVAGSVTTSLAWYDAILSSNITFNSGTNYRVYMTSAATVSPQYQFMRIKTVNNGNANAMTFGGTTNMLAQDSSGTYSTDSSRDVPFRLTLFTSTTTSKTQTGVARITATSSKTQSGKSRIANISTPIQSGKVRITASIIKTILSITRLTALANKLQTAISRITDISLGFVGYALLFDGSQNYVLVKTGGILSGSINASIEVRFNAPSQTAVNGGSLYGERSGGNDIFEIRIQSNNILQFVYRDDAGTLNRVSGSTVVSDSATHTIVVSKSGSLVNIYLDGNPTPEATGSLTASNNQTDLSIKSIIGADNSSGVNYKGIIGNVRLDNRSLSAADASNYHNGLYLDPSSLVGLWNFSEGTGTTTADSSGNGNTGVLTGSPKPAWVNGLLLMRGTARITDVILRTIISTSRITKTTQKTQGVVAHINSLITLKTTASVARLTALSQKLQSVISRIAVTSISGVGYALKFNGINNNVNFTSTSSVLNNLTNFSVSLWFNAGTYSNTNSNRFPRLVQKGNNNGTGWIDINIDDTANKLQLSSGYSTTNLSLAIAEPSARVLHHLVITGDGSPTALNHHIYLDGVEGTYINPIVNAVGTKIADGTRLTFGNRNQDANQRAFQGSIDDIRIYNKILSAAEVAKLYNQQPIDQTNLVGYWSLDDNTGTSALDSSGNGNTGTLNGSPLPIWINGLLPLTSTARIIANAVKTTAAISRITTQTIRVINATCRITVFNLKTQPAICRLLKTSTQSTHSISRMTSQKLKTILAVTRLSLAVRRLTVALVSIKKLTLQLISGNSHINHNHQQNQTSGARIIASRQPYWQRPLASQQNRDLYNISKLPYYN